MKFRILVITVLVGCFVVPALVWAIDNPAATYRPESPVGPGTVPQSSLQSGLVESPNPLDNRINDLVTGNVAGGRHFRGQVPYRSHWDFGVASGSARLDSFLRRSAGAEDWRLPAGTYQGYRSPFQSVATSQPGAGRILRPGDSESGSLRIDDRYGRVELPAGDSLIRPGDSALAGRSAEPQWQSRWFDEQLIRQAERPDGQWRQKEGVRGIGKEQLRQEAAELEEELLREDDLLRYENGQTGREKVPLAKQPGLEAEAGDRVRESGRLFSEAERATIRQGDIYEQMQWQLRSLDGKLGEAAEALLEQAPQGVSGRTGDLGGEKTSSAARPEPETTIQAPGRSEKIFGPYKSFAAYSEDKFNEHMRRAERFLHAGKYYRAADAYTLAALYKQGDPLTYAGKSHALFAAGEYISSALFLSRALEIFPGYARFKVDLEAMVGDRDTLEKRVADAEQWLQQSGDADLKFLLAYLYYQLDRIDKAGETIDAAARDRPDSLAVAALKEAIDAAKD